MSKLAKLYRAEVNRDEHCQTQANDEENPEVGRNQSLSEPPPLPRTEHFLGVEMTTVTKG
jgi:hypothetical protein